MENIAEIHQRFEKKEISVKAFVEKYLQKIRSSSLNTFLSIHESAAMEQAEWCDTYLKNHTTIPPEYPLFGIPIGIKDNICTKGTKTTCASLMLKDYISPYNATVIDKIHQAKGIIVGKCNMDEFAMGGSSEKSAFGPVRNPHDPSRVAGGSSGGSAAAVGAQECILALGSDTGGSVRLPASYCGVFGFKPTYGRISRYGLVAFASSLDQIGIFSHAVEDTARFAKVISGQDPHDATSSHPPIEPLEHPFSFRGCKIGVLKELKDISPAVKATYEKTLSILENQGAEIIPIELRHLPLAISVYYIIAVCEASSNLARFDGIRYGTRYREKVESLIDFYASNRSFFGKEVKKRILLGTFALSSGYQDEYYKKACLVRAKIQKDYFNAFEKVSFILHPVTTHPAFQLGEKNHDPLSMYLNDLFTTPASLAGLPAASLPCGLDQHLPIGMHFTANAFEDSKLLEACAALQKILKENYVTR